MKIDVHSVTVQACAAVAATMRQTQICFQCKEKRTIKTHTQAHTHIYIYILYYYTNNAKNNAQNTIEK
jgi:hypothetical protein